MPDTADRAPVAPRAREALLRYLVIVLDKEAGARSGKDVEDLHDLRVASRRLRAVVEAFAPVLPRKRRRRCARALRRLTRALGVAREWDVHAEAIEDAIAETGPGDEQQALEHVLDSVRARRAREGEGLAHRLDEVDVPALGFDLVDLFGRADAEGRDLRDVARQVVPDRVREAFDGIEDDRATTDVERLHERRIAMKKLRYALEVLGPAFEDKDRCDAVHALAKRCQDALGKHHDANLLAGVMDARRVRLAEAGFSALAGGLERAIARLRATEERHRTGFGEASAGWTAARALDELGLG